MVRMQLRKFRLTRIIGTDDTADRGPHQKALAVKPTRRRSVKLHWRIAWNPSPGIALILCPTGF